MFRSLRTTILIAVFAGLSTVSAGAATIPGCINPADSALNQYCELIPSPTGGKPPTAGTPGVSSTLPPTVLNQIARGTGPQARAARALLSLPAARIARTADVRGQRGHVAKASASSLPLWLYIALAALGLALFGAGLIGWQRRRQQGPPPPGDVPI